MLQPRIITLSLLSALLIFNQYEIVSVKKMRKEPGAQTSSQNTQAKSAEDAQKSAVDAQALAAQLIPGGVPEKYGTELQVSFDNAAPAIDVLSPHEQDTRPDKLTGVKLERYVRLGQRTSCEYCCGAKTLVFPDGSKACGCAHSAAMRGVAAYLIDKYGDEMSDDAILNEMNKWKAVFFPGPTVNKYLAQTGKSASGSLQSQVGGC